MTKARALALLAWLPTAVLFAAGVVLSGLSLASLPQDETLTRGDVLEGIAPVVFALGFGSVGALLAIRRPDNAIGWIFCAAGFVWMWGFFGTAYAQYAVYAHPGGVPAGSSVATFTGWPVAGPALAVFVTFLPLLFPSGRLPRGHRPRVLAWLAGVGMGMIAVSGILSPGRLEEPFESIENPFGLAGAGDALELLSVVGLAFVAATALASITLLARRGWRARGDERQQIKWLAAAAAFVLAASIMWGLYPGSELVQGLALLAIPVATAIAILRYHLYDIDLIIRRTLVYGVLSALLAGCYLGSVLALQQVFSSFAGGSDLAIAISTLAVAALFRPVRGRVQALVDRRFYRAKYDAARTLAAFSARLRDELDLEALSEELRGAVTETVQPAQVSLWLQKVP